MKTLLHRPVRAGLLLSTIVALLAFAARLAEAQPVTNASSSALAPTHAPVSPAPRAR